MFVGDFPGRRGGKEVTYDVSGKGNGKYILYFVHDTRGCVL